MPSRPSMMDEIELQLCLSIGRDPAAERQTQTKPRTQSSPTIQTTAEPESRRGKRAGSEGVDDGGNGPGDDNGGPGPSPGPGDCSPLLNGGSIIAGEIEAHCESGGHLHLPPRKRVRTSLPSPVQLKRMEQDGEDKGKGKENERSSTSTAAVSVTRDSEMKRASVPVSLSASLPEMGSALGELPASMSSTLDMSSYPGSDMVMDTDMGIDMDIDKDLNAYTNTSASLSQSQPRENSLSFPFYRPQSPSTDTFQMNEAYMPALLNSLGIARMVQPTNPSISSARTQPHRPDRFTIYEDPDDMDIDGVGFFHLEPSWYLSPEDDKENADDEGAHEQGEQDQHTHNHGHGSEYRPGHGHEHGNAFHFPEQRSYNPHQYEARTTASFQSHHHHHQQEHDAVQRQSPWARGARRFTIPEPTPPRADVSTAEFALPGTSTSVPSLAHSSPPPPQSTEQTAPFQNLSPERERAVPMPMQMSMPLPSPTSLSATEVSLRALSIQMADGGNGGSVSESRVQRRVRRSVNFD